MLDKVDGFFIKDLSLVKLDGNFFTLSDILEDLFITDILFEVINGFFVSDNLLDTKDEFLKPDSSIDIDDDFPTIDPCPDTVDSGNGSSADEILFSISFCSVFSFLAQEANGLH